MEWPNFHDIALFIQHTISFIGILIILTGVLIALVQYLFFFFTNQVINEGSKVNNVRLNLARILTLGLEFIVAADLIATTTAPDYYSVGIVAIIVVIRTVLNYSLTKEMTSLSQERA